MKFLEENADFFRYESVRRVGQIFTQLSERMGRRRTPKQCKSHHQKMKKATSKGTLKEIISYLKEKIEYRMRVGQCVGLESKNKNFIL